MNAQWLAAQFDLNPAHSKSDLARALGLEPPAISKILGGMRKINAEEYITMRQFFGLPTNEGASTVPDYTLSPLTRADGFKERAHNTDNTGADSWVIPAKVLGQRTDASADKIKVFENCETLMEPDFKKGEFVVVDTSDTHPSPSGVFVLHDGFGHLLRTCSFVAKSDPPSLEISATSASFQTQTLLLTDVDITGRVIAKLDML